MIPNITLGKVGGIPPLLSKVLVVSGLLIVGEFAISYALDRIKWEQQFRWPLAVAIGVLTFLVAWTVLPALGVGPAELIVAGSAILVGHVIARYRIWPGFRAERLLYDAIRRTTGWTAGLKSSYQIEQLYSRPLVLTLQVYALLAGMLHGLYSRVVIQTLPATFRDAILAFPAADSVIVGVVGLGIGAMGGTILANQRVQTTIARLEPPSKRGDLVCAGRVAAEETGLAKPYDQIKPTGEEVGAFGIQCLPADAPISPDGLGITPRLSQGEKDYSRFPAIDRADGGKAHTTAHDATELFAALAFEYVDADEDTETDSNESPHIVRFTNYAASDDRRGGQNGQLLFDYVIWQLTADRYIVTADNPFDYQALYELGFAYAGETTAEGVKLERPGPVLADDVTHDEILGADRPKGKRGLPEAVADAAPIDRTTDTYRAGLRAFLEEEALAETLSDDARTFINEHLDLTPPPHQSYWQSAYYKAVHEPDATTSGSKPDATPSGSDTFEQTPADSPDPTDSTLETMSDQFDDHPLANQYTQEQLANGHYDWQYSDVRFDDIGGYYEVKQALVDEIIEPLHAAAEGDDRFERFGIEPERGILFYGPPGTGKTMFARALAGQLQVPFVELSPADVTSKWINEGPQLVNRLFAEADRLGPCVIFLDEAEHLFGARDTGGRSTHAEDSKITSEFLVHLTDDDRDAIVVSATNRPGDIDPAILRPGRLSTHYEVGLPDEEARQAILATHLEDIPSALTVDDRAELAAHTRGFSGADLGDLVDDAKRTAAKRDAEAVTRDDFPSIDELDTIVADLKAEADVDTLPDPDDDSTRVDLDTETETESNDADSDADTDDTPVGFQ